MPAPITEQQWVEIDRYIFGRGILLAVTALKRYAGVDLREALELHRERYNLLRERSPEKFTCSDEEYWQDVFS